MIIRLKRPSNSLIVTNDAATFFLDDVKKSKRPIQDLIRAEICSEVIKTRGQLGRGQNVTKLTQHSLLML